MMRLGTPLGTSYSTKDLSFNKNQEGYINPNIYFRGIYFNQDFENVQDGVKFIDEMLEDFSYHKDRTKVFLQHKAVYFETGITSYADDEFRRLKGDHNNPHKTLYLYHFFDIDEIKDNHFKLHALLSNIENLQRLIVSAVYILAPNIPFKRNNDQDSMYVTSSDINTVFDNLKVDDKSIVGEEQLIYDICNTSSIEELKNELESFINTYYKEFQLIKDIINLDKGLIKSLTNNIHSIRGMVSHHRILDYKLNDTLEYDRHIPICEDVYQQLEKLLEKLFEYTNICNDCSKQVNLEDIVTCPDCKIYIGHIDTKKTECLEFEYVKCSNCEHFICKECLEESKGFFDISIWYCSGCNKLYCEDCVTECENCGDAYYCEECKDKNMQSCESCNSEFCLTCAEEIQECKHCDTTQICPMCSDDGDYCNYCDERFNKDD